jgi:hypothetical protein
MEVVMQVLEEAVQAVQVLEEALARVIAIKRWIKTRSY